MGVLKLWQLLLTIAQPTTIEHLSGKVLAIDASIWIVKIDSLYSTNVEKIKSILSKIMVLKRNNILPVFVFDGVPPALKRRTLEERSKRRIITSNLQAKKRSEIQIMHLIEGDSTRLSDKSKKTKKNEEDLSQINKTLKNLSELREEGDVPKELLEKIVLQSDILNAKYKIMLEITPQLSEYFGFIGTEEYQELDLQRKIQYLDQLQEYKWGHIKKMRKNQKSRQSMNEEEKLKEDLIIIQKKSIIRQMQDNLFRKMMQKHVKIEDGFQIIQTVYNGKKMIQKRKIKEGGNNSGLFGLRKGKMKNDSNCLNFNESNKQLSEEDQIQPQDPFVGQFCRSVAPKELLNSKANINLNILPKIQQKSSKIIKMKKNQTKPKPSLHYSQNQSESRQQDSGENYMEKYLGFGQIKQRQQEQPQIYVNKNQFNIKLEKQQEQAANRDKLPNFSSDDHNEYQNFSNDNIQLQNLLKILGLPFVIAPSQAEAQCASLQQQGIVDGIVTQDSDIFLFGGKNVYRGVFNNNIRFYSYERIQQKLKMNREKLIIFALLLGSDYTDGVKGVGIVNAMEILKVFNTFQKIKKFKKWAQHPDVLLPIEETTSALLQNATEEQVQFYELHKKFKNYWYIDQSFSSQQVRKAYLQPQVISPSQTAKLKQLHRFEESQIKQNLLRQLLTERLELQDKQFEHFWKLLTFKYKAKRENTLDSFVFKRGDNQEMAKIRSKRLQKSIGEDE